MSRQELAAQDLESASPDGIASPIVSSGAPRRRPPESMTVHLHPTDSRNKPALRIGPTSIVWIPSTGLQVLEVPSSSRGFPPPPSLQGDLERRPSRAARRGRRHERACTCTSGHACAGGACATARLRRAADDSMWYIMWGRRRTRMWAACVGRARCDAPCAARLTLESPRSTYLESVEPLTLLTSFLTSRLLAHEPSAGRYQTAGTRSPAPRLFPTFSSSP